MALFKIKELYDYYKTLPTLTNQRTFLFNYYIGLSILDTMPQYIVDYFDKRWLNDPKIARDYGEWVYTVDCDTIIQAYECFVNDNFGFFTMHQNELNIVHRAFSTDFNPLENYDRTEVTGVGENNNVNSTSGVTSKVSPDDNELFYNTNENSATSGTIASTQRETNSHIHGNIGVTSTTALARESTDFYGDNGMYDYLVNKLIGLNCILIV